MASFLDQLRKASFRGVPFHVPDDEEEFARRIATHLYPGRDKPFQEDFGADASKLSITAVVGGKNFITDAQALHTALHKPGTGILIHPHHGEIEVVFISARRAHSADAVGDVIFSITFERAGAPLYPAATVDTASGLDTASSALFGSLEEEFKGRFKYAGIPDFITGDGLERANVFTAQLGGIFSKNGLQQLLQGGLPEFTLLSEDFGNDVIAFFQGLSASARPQKTPVIGPAPAAPATQGQIRAMIRGFSEAARFSVNDAQTPITSTASTRQANARALDNLFRAAALASIGTTARYAEYESVEQALAMRQDIATSISEVRDQLGAYGWDDSWRAAGKLLSSFSRDINDRIGRLPSVVTIRPASVRTSLDLANRLYGDDAAAIFSRADDLASRNRVKHPGFVPVRDMEVLIDAA